MDAPGITPDSSPKLSFGERARGNMRGLVHAFTTREGLVGDYDYAFLFTPNIPFVKRERRAAPFFSLDGKMPVLLAMLLGFQHALAMLAGIITPPIILSSSANLPQYLEQYLVSIAINDHS